MCFVIVALCNIKHFILTASLGIRGKKNGCHTFEALTITGNLIYTK